MIGSRGFAPLPVRTISLGLKSLGTAIRHDEIEIIPTLYLELHARRLYKYRGSAAMPYAQEAAAQCIYPLLRV